MRCRVWRRHAPSLAIEFLNSVDHAASCRRSAAVQRMGRCREDGWVGLLG
jgi:hypothetical protein